MNKESLAGYATRLQSVLTVYDWGKVLLLAESLQTAWKGKRRVFLCGNGGSAANAMHISNDLLYGVAKDGHGIKVSALSANTSVLTCLGNDLGYDEIFSRQLAVQAEPGDVLIVLSGSGNSPNVVKALQKAREIGVKSFAVLGYSGGQCLKLADVAIHFPVNDMQIAEDLQLIVGHMVMQTLSAASPE
jgi:D-sedoheptulose 7-phosphate isomerase